MAKDPVMIDHIINGNASDPKLKRDAEVHEQAKADKDGKIWRENKLKKIKEVRERYHAKYGRPA